MLSFSQAAMNQPAVDRPAISERICAEYIKAGIGFEDDPIFIEWVEPRIDGGMTGSELRSRYLRLVQ
jgi:hypothetical protein